MLNYSANNTLKIMDLYKASAVTYLGHMPHWRRNSFTRSSKQVDHQADEEHRLPGSWLTAALKVPTAATLHLHITTMLANAEELVFLLYHNGSHAAPHPDVYITNSFQYFTHFFP